MSDVWRPNQWLGRHSSKCSRTKPERLKRGRGGYYRLTEIIFVQTIRYWIKTHKDEKTGWLAALSDAQISRALNLLHQDPTGRFTQPRPKSGMSRSPFAANFTRLVGKPPLKNLIKWRMNPAADYLQLDELCVAEIAGKVGYENNAVFSKKTLIDISAPRRVNFKRIKG